ncbi:Mrp/NBP35 family ATP-binding protein [Oecophyllibacter saccharovorans]|uniref:Iron-sulfur cluster carrier protein n=1 Tax=Oecophyllibacter saccharovorans TaxID=2558360 RepID=A0A506URM1_9PROT|nr:Mrp/NBP35 family ATP-binding protein [Oecophyllibacter saccharovorans]TPW35994.1 ATP-binding protein [Oecophyllibacter saccharovorans]
MSDSHTQNSVPSAALQTEIQNLINQLLRSEGCQTPTRLAGLSVRPSSNTQAQKEQAAEEAAPRLWAHAVIEAVPGNATQLGTLRPRLQEEIAALLTRNGLAVAGTTIALTAHRVGHEAAAPKTTGPRPAGHRPLGVGKEEEQGKPALPGVKAVIAVASGKGGVGKSTTAVNLACALAQRGLKTGLLDADIHGPSLARMLGEQEKPRVVDRKLQPLERWGIKTMSIGYLADEKQAMIWRGPMVMGAVTQFITDVDWGELDVLVVDMPPGTGDAQLTLTQLLGSKLEKGGAIIVSTPQDIALLDARRGVTLFGRTGTPVLGIVENMSYFCCPNCHEKTDLFGHGGARREAEELGVPFLAEIPLLRAIRASGDEGQPISVAEPDSEAGKAYQTLAERVAAIL